MSADNAKDLLRELVAAWDADTALMRRDPERTLEQFMQQGAEWCARYHDLTDRVRAFVEAHDGR